MRNRNSLNMRLLATLATVTVAWACDYNAFEHPNDFAYRYCAVACNKMEVTDANYEPCCRMLSKGAETAAVCTQLASSAVAAGSTCSQTQVATTDSTSYSKPTTYSTAANPALPVTSAPQPTTSGVEGQSINSPVVVTEWTTTTVTPPCEPTTPPVSEPAATDTCMCSDEAPPAATSAPPETGGIEGQAYSSAPATSGAPEKPEGGDWAGNTPPEGYEGLDRRTEQQYTCACWVPPPASSTPPTTSGIEGVEYSSAPAPAPETPSATPTSECTTSTGGDWAGNTPTGEVIDNERRNIPTGEVDNNDKRFLPTIYGPGPVVTGSPVVKRHTRFKRTGDAGDGDAALDDGDDTSGAAALTITSTATVTGTPTCGADAPAAGTDSADWAGNTAGSEVAENDNQRKRFRRWLK